MKKFPFSKVVALLAIPLLLTACNNEKTADESITTNDIPISSKFRPPEAVAAFNEGLKFLDDNNRVLAQKSFARATQLDSTFGMAYIYNAANSRTTENFMAQLEKAKQHLDTANAGEKLMYDFQYSYVTNNWDDRMAAVKKMVSLYPASARAQTFLGQVYQEANQSKEERAAFEKAIELDSQWVGGYNLLASSYFGSEPKDFKRGEEYALKLTKLAPSNSNAQVVLGDAYRALDSMDKADAAYSKAISLDPKEATAYYKKGHVNTFAGKYDEARKSYMAASKLDEDEFGGHLWSILTYAYAGDSKKAIGEFENYAAHLDSSSMSKSQVENDKYNIYVACAMICLQAGDGAGVKKYATLMKGPAEVVATEVGTPEERTIQENFVRTWTAIGYALEGSLDSAKLIGEEVKKALEPIKIPTKLQAYNRLQGLISMKEKNYGQAISHFENGDPFSIYTKYLIAKANEAAGNMDKAKALYKEVALYNFNSVDFAICRADAKNKAKQ